MSMSIWPYPSNLKKTTKSGTFARKKNGARPTNPYILESVSPRECHKHIYKATPLSVLKNNNNKMVLTLEKRIELQA